MEKIERLASFGGLSIENFSCRVFLSLVTILAAVTLIRSWILPSRKSKLLQKVPGPPPQVVLGNLGNFIKAYKKGGNGAVFEHLNYLCRKYIDHGMFKIWMCWRPMVLLQKPKEIEVLLSSNVALSKAPDYNLIHPWLGTGLLTSTGSKWRSRRKLLTPTFHFRILEEFLPVFHEQSMVLVQKLKQSTYSAIDIIPYITLCALDIICETAMGTQIEAQTIDSEYVTSLKIVGEATFARVFKPWHWNYKLYKLTSPGRKYTKNLAVVHNFTRKVIKDKKEDILRSTNNGTKDPSESNNTISKRKRLAFLDLLLHYHIEDKSLTENDIQEEVDTFMFEGHDTTATGMIWALHNIGLYPTVQEKIHEELYDIFGDDTERPVTADDLKRMKYLECVLKESQRVHPSVPFIGRDLHEDLDIGGVIIPKGSTCAINIYLLHHNPEIHSNPEVFNPERFTVDDSLKRHPYSYVPFSAGPRNCIGQKFAMMEEKTVVTNILRNFTIRSLDKPGSIPMLSELVLRPGKEVMVELHPKGRVQE